MRLVDADTLLNNVKRAVYTDDLSTTIAVGICESHIKDMPIVDAIAIEPLAEWLAGYAAPPKYAIDAVGGLREMADATKRAKAWEFALTSMERSGFLEARVE